MDLVEAHAAFAEMDDEGRLPLETLLEADGETFDGSAIAATAFASLSGRLDDCRDEADLLDALEHGWCLFNAGVIDEDNLKEEGEAVIKAVLLWGERREQCSTG